MLAFNITDSIFHAHIYRTGGRWVRELFRRNRWNTTHDDFTEIMHNWEVPHLPYPYWSTLYGVDEQRSFVVVRHPLTRFVSSLGGVPDNVFQAMSKSDFFDVLRFSALGFTEQWHYLSPNTKIYKFEDGMNENFVDWINSSFKLNLVYYNDITYDMDVERIDKKPNQFLIDSINQDWIREFYKHDYEMFEYE
jgi:hypothetical protein